MNESIRKNVEMPEMKAYFSQNWISAAPMNQEDYLHFINASSTEGYVLDADGYIVEYSIKVSPFEKEFKQVTWLSKEFFEWQYRLCLDQVKISNTFPSDPQAFTIEQQVRLDVVRLDVFREFSRNPVRLIDFKEMNEIAKFILHGIEADK